MVALAVLPIAVADDTFAVQPAQVALEKSPNAEPPFEADAVLPMAIEPVAIAPVPNAIELMPVAWAPLPMAIAFVALAKAALPAPVAPLPPIAMAFTPAAWALLPNAEL